jgi:hypothetical protein
MYKYLYLYCTKSPFLPVKKSGEKNRRTETLILLQVMVKVKEGRSQERAGESNCPQSKSQVVTIPPSHNPPVKLQIQTVIKKFKLGNCIVVQWEWEWMEGKPRGRKNKRILFRKNIKTLNLRLWYDTIRYESPVQFSCHGRDHDQAHSRCPRLRFRFWLPFVR